ncbi:MAG: hypothetical protein FWD60_00330 [Candidatus Azobacteroides sp.]|nr:hypothetical protein [Candidatus Azobacteroides sp.]
MKRVYLLIACISLFYFTGISQTKSVNIDNFWVTYSYRAQPINPMDPAFFYYFPVVNATSVVKNNVSVEEIEDAMFIRGQKRTQNPDEVSMELILTLGNIIVVSSEVSERKEESKGKDGKITTSYYYKVNVQYNFESSGLIKWKGKDLLRIPINSRSNNLVFTSREYSSRKEAADFWNNNRDVHLSNLYRNLSLEAANTISQTATTKYGFRGITGERVLLKTINEKKHNENTDLRAAVQALKDIFQATTPNDPPNRDKIDPLIRYFKSIPERFTEPDGKADPRLRYVAYYNLARIYLFLLDDPETAIKYADLITANGQDVKDGAKLRKEAEELIASFEKSGVKTRFFDPELKFNTEQ